jgi:hypothetical protein
MCPNSCAIIVDVMNVEVKVVITTSSISGKPVRISGAAPAEKI